MIPFQKFDKLLIFILFQTFEKIAYKSFSVAIFAPGWTHEVMDISKFFCEPGSDEYREKRNASFLERNDLLWSSLYEYMNICGPRSLPFQTNFSIGSGKGFYRMGSKVKSNWFNLRNQGILPSTPATRSFYQFSYQDAFDGGNCISIQSKQFIRLFTCDFSGDSDMFFSYTFKRADMSDDIQFRLNYKFTVDDQFEEDAHVVTLTAEPTFEKTIKTCNENAEIREIGKFLASRGETFVPNNINGWETRYYFIKFSHKVKITDIGARKIGRSDILLGFMSILSMDGFNSNNCKNVNVL